MNPKHRDYVAFIRIVSGVFRRDMQVIHTRTGKKLRLSELTAPVRQGTRDCG